MGDAVNGLVRPFLPHIHKMGVEGFALHPRPVGKALRHAQKKEQGLLALTMPCGVFRCLAGDAGAEFIVHPEEGFAVAGVLGKADDVRDVPSDAVGEKAWVHLAAAVGNTLPGEEVDEGQGAVVVPVEHGGLPVTLPGHF